MSKDIKISPKLAFPMTFEKKPQNKLLFEPRPSWLTDERTCSSPLCSEQLIFLLKYYKGPVKHYPSHSRRKFCVFNRVFIVSVSHLRSHLSRADKNNIISLLQFEKLIQKMKQLAESKNPLPNRNSSAFIKYTTHVCTPGNACWSLHTSGAC